MEKLLQLDGLRAIAVFLVLIQHFVPQGHVLLKLITWGTIGVQLFFVLSGFLITRILLDARTRIDCGATTLGFTLRQFHIRRILRIFPVFYVSLLRESVREGEWRVLDEYLPQLLALSLNAHPTDRALDRRNLMGPAGIGSGQAT